MRSAVVLVTVGMLVVASRAQELEISTQHATMQAGKSTELKWTAKNAERVFISGVGIVAVEGSHSVKPDRTTKYMIIAEGKFGVVFKTVSVEVTGARGADYPTEYDSFKYPISNRHRAASLVVFMDQVFHALQDDLGFSAYGPFPSSSGNFIFITNFRRRGDLVQPDEKTVAERHISYLVEIENNAKQYQEYQFTIKALIEYRKKIERTWRVEEREDVYRLESGKLKTIIDTLPN